MDAATVRADLAGRGITLRADGDTLKARGHLTNELRQMIRQYKTDLLALLTAPHAPSTDDCATINEAIEERAAIREYDAGESPEEAERHAREAMRVYRFRLADRPDDWLVMIAPDCDLEAVRRSLTDRFGLRLIEVWEHRKPNFTE